MTTAQRLAALEAEVAELRELADPQVMRLRLERTMDPRGGEPRVVDQNGRTLDYQGAIQFPGTVATVDPVKQRVIVTVTPPELKGVFSDDNTTTDAERLRFVWETDATKNRYVVNTRSAVAGQRAVDTILAEDSPTTSDNPRVSDTWTINDNAQFSANSTLTARAAGAAALSGLDKESRVVVDAQNASTSASLHSQNNSGVADISTSAINTAGANDGTAAMSASGPGAVNFSLRSSSLSGVTQALIDTGHASGSRVVLNQNQEAHYLQCDAAPTLAAAPVRRVIRGPYTVAVVALAAGATQNATLVTARVLNSTDYVVVGGANGAAGSEALLWSWVGSGAPAKDVDINITNVSAGALTATMRFYIISTS